jgi:hypothetical protein
VFPKPKAHLPPPDCFARQLARNNERGAHFVQSSLRALPTAGRGNLVEGWSPLSNPTLLCPTCTLEIPLLQTPTPAPVQSRYLVKLANGKGLVLSVDEDAVRQVIVLSI